MELIPQFIPTEFPFTIASFALQPAAPRDGIMTSQVDPSRDKATCLKLISLGYARSNRVRLYGQEVQLISDPFPHQEGGIAVEVLQGSESSSRTIKLPLSVLQVAGQAEKKRSA